MIVLRVGSAYEIQGEVPVMPVHTDDLGSLALGDVGRMRRVKDPEVVILEVRPRALSGTLWYRVSLRDGTEGWINSVALLSSALVPA